MLHFHLKLPAGGAAALLAFLLASSSAAQGASLPRYHSRLFRGGGDTAEGRPAAAYPPPSSDMMKALEYIESLKQKSGGAKEAPPPVDYDEVDKIRVLLQLASLQDEGGAAGRQSPPPPPPPPAAAAQRQQQQDLPAEQLVKVLLKSLQDQAGMRDANTNKAAPAAAAPPPPPAGSNNRHRHRAEGAGGPAGGDYGNFPRPHKKYPLMFEDEENRDAFRRATEDLDEQYTPQSLANLRSIFDELGRMPITANGQKRDDGDEDEDMFSLRNLAYDDVTGGEEDSWVPVEERMETEELVNGSHDEYERGLAEGDLMEGAEREEMQRRASQNDDDEEEADDDTKLVDYYLLKVLEMSDQTQKRDAGEQRKRLIRPSLVDPRTVKELLELSLKLHVPPQDLIDLLITDELRKLHRHPQTATTTTAHFRTGQTPKIRYYSRRLPVAKSKVAPAPEDMDREDFLDIIGVETISNEYPVRQRPLKPAGASPARAPPASVPSAPAAAVRPVPAIKVPSPSGRRENLFLSELNKMPLKRQASDDGDDDDDDVEDEVTTYLAAKILTEYPQSGISKRDTSSQAQFPYELYEQAMKDFLDQADTGKGKVAKRETESAPPAEEAAVEPSTETHDANEMAQPLKTAAPQTTADEEEKDEHRGKQIAGM